MDRSVSDSLAPENVERFRLVGTGMGYTPNGEWVQIEDFESLWDRCQKAESRAERAESQARERNLDRFDAAPARFSQINERKDKNDA